MSISSLLTQLTSPDAKTRASAAQRLGEMGTAARDALGPLRNALADSDPAVRRLALEALHSIAPDPCGLFDVYRRVLSDPKEDYFIRVDTAGYIGDGRAAGIALLNEMSQMSDATGRFISLQQLGELFRSASRADRQTIADALLRGALDEAETVRWKARGALEDIGKKAVPILSQVFGSEDAMTRSLAASAVLQASPTHLEALRQMIAELENDDPAVRRVAARGLGFTGKKYAPEAWPALMRCLQDEDAEVIQRAAEALREMKSRPPAMTAVPALAGGLRRCRDWDARIVICEALAKYKTKAAPAVPELLQLLQDYVTALEEGTLTWSDEAGFEGGIALMAVLEYIGPPARAAIPLLQEIFDRAAEAENECLMENANAAIDSVDRKASQFRGHPT